MSQDQQSERETSESTSRPSLLASCQSLVDCLFTESGAASWGLSKKGFLIALERSAAKRFAGTPVAPGQVQEYLSSLHLRDLALACACAEGLAEAWEHFVSIYQSYLRAAA